MEMESSIINGDLQVTRKIKTRSLEVTDEILGATATTANKGLVQLSSSIASPVENMAATPKIVREVFDTLNVSKLGKTGSSADDLTFGNFKIKFNSAVNALDIEVI